MSYSENEVFYRQIIMDHYQLPRNKGLIGESGYTIVHLKNPSCGDDLMIQVKIEDSTITDIHYEGTGCAICCASSSMLTEQVKGKSTEEALEYLQAFSQMMVGGAIDEDVLGEAIALQGVAKLPPRIKCATLGHKALEQAITNDAEVDEGVEIIAK